MDILNVLLAIGIAQVAAVVFGAGALWFKVNNTAKVLSDHITFEERFHHATRESLHRHGSAIARMEGRMEIAD